MTEVDKSEWGPEDWKAFSEKENGERDALYNNEEAVEDHKGSKGYYDDDGIYYPSS